MTSTTGTDSTQIPVNFGDPDGRRRGGLGQWYDPCSIWSCRFSADGNEIVAGGVGGIFGM
jgi:DDB1- and CUL4-associated factor 11